MKKNFTPLDRLSIFFFLWACYMLCHQEYYSNWLIHMQAGGWLLTGSIIAVLLAPRSIFLFLIMISLGGVERASRLPGVVNHLLIELFIDAAILAAFFAVVYERKKSTLSAGWREALTFSNHTAREQFFERLAPVLRIMYVIVYAFAFLSKLNYDFFNPEVSCGSALYRDLLRVIPVLPTGNWVNLLVIWGTVIIEAAMPLCFAFRRTWKYGLMIGLPFHIILGLAGHRAFSAQAVSLYFLFISPAFTEVINECWLKIRAAAGRAFALKWLSPARVVILGTILVVMAIEIIGPENLRTSAYFRYNRMLIWLLWSLALVPIFGAAVCRGRTTEQGILPHSGYRLGFLWVMPALVALNGMSQYLGIKTEHSFTMFSNLRTEAGVNNHLFMPSWLKLTRLQDDLVDIVESDHPDFQFYRDHAQFLTYFEFKRLASQIEGDFEVVYLRGGKRQRLVVQNGMSNQAEITQKHPVWLDKLLRFRPISKGPCMECFH